MFLDLVKMPLNDPVYRCLISTLTHQVNTLLKLRDDKTGLWHTLLNDADSYVETSATAGFAGGMLMGVRLVSR